ncbi:MAG: hypothetical protein MPW15_22345 [Candidatus Manganitrophus sp.]|nr:hypothetical protein [Candidatus Manganitrophus sp.]
MMFRKIKIILDRRDGFLRCFAFAHGPIVSIRCWKRLQSNYSFIRLLALQEVGRFAILRNRSTISLLLIEALKDKDPDVQLNGDGQDLIAALGKEPSRAFPP